MAINPRAVAVEGVGYGSMAFAVLGLFVVRVGVGIKSGGPTELAVPFGGKKVQKIEHFYLKIWYHNRLVVDRVYTVKPIKFDVYAKLLESIYYKVGVLAKKLEEFFERIRVGVRLK